MAHYKEEVRLSTKFKRFNVFTSSGENVVVKSDKPMTLDEAMYEYNALAIGGID